MSEIGLSIIQVYFYFLQLNNQIYITLQNSPNTIFGITLKLQFKTPKMSDIGHLNLNVINICFEFILKRVMQTFLTSQI